MENLSPIAMPKPMPYPMPNMMPNIMPVANAPVATSPAYTAPMMPINVHASYEEVNIYAPKKHHHHCHSAKGPGWNSVGSILVLYILLVIILRGAHRI